MMHIVKDQRQMANLHYRPHIHKLSELSIQAHIQKDKEITRQLEKGVDQTSDLLVLDPRNEVKFHTARFGQYNRFADMISKRIKIGDLPDPRRATSDKG